MPDYPSPPPGRATARGQLNEQAARLVAEMAELPAPPYPQVTAEQVRAYYRGLARWVAPPVEVAEVFDWPNAPGSCAVRIYRSAAHAWGSQRPLLVYLHSGGWVVGGLVASDERCRRLAAVTGCVVASLDYRLAPEHPFPTPLEDSWSALVALGEHAAALDATRHRVVVIGDSAGGNLAAALALRARDRGSVDVAYQILLYPVTAADRSGFDSPVRYAEGYPLTMAELNWFISAYLGGSNHDPETAPLCARELTGAPPALVITAECDVLRDEGEAYAARLRAAGVRTELHRMAGTVHGFFACSAALDAAHDATGLVARSLAARFGLVADLANASGGTDS